MRILVDMCTMPSVLGQLRIHKSLAGDLMLALQW